jgi:hypothetical protein
MKKSIIAIVAMISWSAGAQASYSVNLNDLANEAICQSNAASFYPGCEKPQQNPGLMCDAKLTQERMGNTTNERFEIPANQEYHVNAGQRVYHDEDETGSTTVYLDDKTLKGSITIMDTSQVIASGPVQCK